MVPEGTGSRGRSSNRPWRVSWVAALATPDMSSENPALQPPVLKRWWDGDGEGHPHSGMFETDRSVIQRRRIVSRAARCGAWLACDHGNKMQYSGMVATQSVTGDNLESAPAGVAAPERSAPQPFYITQQ